MPEILKIEGRGEGLALIRTDREDTFSSDGDTFSFPDPIERFIAFANAGFAITEPLFQLSDFTLLNKGLQAAPYRWLIQAEKIHRSCLYLIENTLRFINVQSCFMIKQDTLYGEALIENYPRVFQYLLAREVPFEVILPQDADYLRKGCSIFIEFVNVLDKDLANSVCVALEKWVDFLVFGGYFFSDSLPGDATTLPGAAYQYDPQTICIEFSEVFEVDPACFESLKHYLGYLHYRKKCLISKLIVSA